MVLVPPDHAEHLVGCGTGPDRVDHEVTATPPRRHAATPLRRRVAVAGPDNRIVEWSTS
ncbi:hypothetical protein [Streptomyces sp. FIT100]|uniref:hypothetical protein n=1 Tax=Streptomyces sp. FIT100 TaxID=2837956 RepID=UPI0021CA5D5C|nr:hypothetical protein [Streptomyces sp. FIT100]UUN29876.1 hypothetical protein KK483_28495 [Streptomyces sp. FIT100]